MDRSAQVQFLEHARSRLPQRIQWAEELSELLNIGIDSAYRRIRGETALTFNEAVVVSRKYDISLDYLFKEGNERVEFDAGHPIRTLADYADYTKRVVDRMLDLEKHREDLHMYYAAMDFPLFYVYQLPEMARMKTYFWARTIIGIPEFQGFSLDDFQLPPEREAARQVVSQAYAGIPGTEIWTPMCFYGTLKQIQFLWDTGLIKSRDVALGLLAELDTLADRLWAQAEAGRKWVPAKNAAVGAPFRLFLSELSLGNNGVVLEHPSGPRTFLSYNTFNFIETSQPAFAETTMAWIQQVCSRSTEMSSVAKAERDRYIAKLKRQVESIRQYLVNDQETLL